MYKIILRFSYSMLLSILISYSQASENSQNYHLYFWANYNQLEHHNDVAQHCYDILFKQHKNPYIYPGFLVHLMQTKQFDAILRLMPLVESTQKIDFSTHLIFINALEATGKHHDVIQRLTALSKQYPEQPEVMYYTATAHAEQNRFSQALDCVDTYLKTATHSNKNFIFYFLKAQIFSKLGNTEQAIVNAKKSLELYPAFDQGWLFLGLMYELLGSLDQALTHYQTCLTLVGHNPLLEQQILQIQLKRQHLLQNNPNNNQVFNQALSAYDQKDYQKALQLLNQTPSLHNHVQSRLLKIELLCKVQQTQEAIALLTQWLLNDETNDTWYQTLHLLHKAGIPTTIILQTLTQLEQKNSNNILPLLYKADIYLRSAQKELAITFLNKALQHTHQPLLKTKILFQLGLIYYQDKKWDTMLEVLLAGKRLQQNFAPLLNLLAYYYVTQENNLKESELLILDALKQSTNPHFLDTYALILYKQKKYDEAHKILTRIIPKAPQDSTILYHLAKTMQKKGLPAQAQSTLKNAINFCSLASDKESYKQCLEKWNSR